MIATFNSSDRFLNLEPGKQMTNHSVYYCQTGPLLVIAIPWTTVDRVVEFPAAFIVPPVDAIPLFTTRLLLPSIAMVKVPLVGVPEAESTMLGFSGLNPTVSPS